jgi:hypothetical protein
VIGTTVVLRAIGTTIEFARDAVHRVIRISAKQNQQDQAIAYRHIAGAGVSPLVTGMTHKSARISQKALVASLYGIRG